MISPKIYRVINAILFYVNWIVCLDAALGGKPLNAVFATGVILAIHFLLVPNRIQELILIVAVVAMGCLIDTALLHFDVVTFVTPNRWLPWLSPIWILCLYAVFATSLNHSLAYLDRHWMVAAIFGAGGGGFSYFVGSRVGAVHFLLPNFGSLAVIALIWLFFLPLLFRFRDWLAIRMGRDILEK